MRRVAGAPSFEGLVAGRVFALTSCVLRCRIAVLLSICLTVGVAGCGSSSTSVATTAPSGTRCSISATASSRSFPPTGGTGSLAISSARECPWTVGSDAAWIVPERADGQGEATLSFKVIANGTPTARRGVLTIDSARIEVAQDGVPCRYDLDATHVTVAASGGPAQIRVSAMNGCAWTARAIDPWITIAGGMAADGNASVQLSVAANSGPARQGSLTVANQTVVVTQAAATSTPPPNGGRVELDGRVSSLAGSCPTLTFAVSGTRIYTTADTKYREGNCKHVENGARVIAVGERQGDGRVRAERIDIKERN